MPVVQHAGASGLLGFLQTRFSSATAASGAVSATSPSRARKLPGGLGDIDAPHEARTPAVYPVSTVVIIALIAFLIGSLFRSLLSPADFIYVVRELGEDEEAKGWREIRRLIEVKYIAWGYDVHIAFVRRH